MDEQHITVTQDGPYLVSGNVPLSRRRALRSELDEPLVWQTKAQLETGEQIALCRCGASSNKPFCDGTHRTIGFDGTEAAPTSTYDERATTLEAGPVQVRDDRGICEHAGFCGNSAGNVWKMAGVAQTDTGVRSHLMGMVERCPSGALTLRVTEDSSDLEPLLPRAVGVVDDGPLYVTGGVAVSRADGQPFETRNRVTLCRCGRSAIKPLCDGSHAKVGFTDS
jgi:CDGSH-type Zn-finger protein